MHILITNFFGHVVYRVPIVFPRRRQWHPTPVLLLRVRHDWLHFHFSLSCIGEGNGNLLQCSCLENHRDSRAWWAAVYGLQSWTWLKWRSISSSRLAPITQERLYWFKATFQMAALNTYPAGLVAIWNLYTKDMF